MPLTLYFHPMSSFCMKALVALYEAGVPFTPHLVDLTDPVQRAALLARSPLGRFPVLHDTTGDQNIAESSIIIEHLAIHHNAAALLPGDPVRALAIRARDRFFDLYVHLPMQRIVFDRLRPADRRDPYGVEQASAQLLSAYAILDDWLRDARWAAGDGPTLADCAAAPALFYASKLVAIPDGPTAAYLARLVAWPAFARVLAEAAPYLARLPQ